MKLQICLNRFLIITGVVMIAFGAISAVYGQDNHQNYLKVESLIWEHQQYALANSKINSVIKKQNYDKHTVPQQLIYYKGVAMCCSGHTERGKNQFDWLVKNFELKEEVKNSILEQKKSCVSQCDRSDFSPLYGKIGSAISYENVELPGVNTQNDFPSKNSSSDDDADLEYNYTEGEYSLDLQDLTRITDVQEIPK